MQYFKSAALNVWNTSKSYVVDTRTTAQKLIDQISNSKQQIISTTKLNELANMTYQSQKFEEITDLLLKRIKIFKYDIDQAKKTLNIMIAINYVIKHGASGFVDELRSFIGYFKQYQMLKQQKAYQSQTMQKQLDYQLQKIKSRANHIQTLLVDKKKLLKQKQLSMLIKQKMKMYQKNKMSQLSSLKVDFSNVSSAAYQTKNQRGQENQNNPQNDLLKKKRLKQMMGQIDGYMQKYLWKYVDKLDDQIESISQKVINKIDKYILGQIPQNGFQMDSDDQDQQKNKNGKQKFEKQQEKPVGYASLDNDDDQFMKQLQQQGKQVKTIQNNNLLQFQQVQQPQQQKKQEKRMINSNNNQLNKQIKTKTQEIEDLI